MGPEDWSWSTAVDISEDGRIVGNYRIEGGNGTPEGIKSFLWEGGKVIDLPISATNGHVSFDLQGSVIWTYYDGSISVYHPDTGTFALSDQHRPAIEAPPGFRRAEVTSINHPGEVAGTLYPKRERNFRGKGARGFVASGRNVAVIGAAPGGETSVVWRINDAGQVVGGPAREEVIEGFIPLDGRAFLYDLRSKETTDLGTLRGFDGSVAWGINDAGEVVGEAWKWGAKDQPEVRAVLFDPSKKRVQDLNGVIPPDSGWFLTSAYDINNAGQIVGEGVLGGSAQAFLLQPVPRLHGSNPAGA